MDPGSGTRDDERIAWDDERITRDGIWLCVRLDTFLPICAEIAAVDCC